MKTRTVRRLHRLASASLFATFALAASASHAQIVYPSEAPPQHRATRADPSDTTPMTVVASTNTVSGQGWYWVPIDGAKCRHNGDTGIAVRLRPDSDKIVITLQGGGACYSGASCGANVYEYGLADFQAGADANASTSKGKLYEGIWKLSASGTAGVAPNASVPNKIGDRYSQIFVPYCSGDMHVGASPNTNVPGVLGLQNFQGAQNTNLYYHYLVDQLLPRIRQPKVHVVLSGLSGGGFGAALTAGKLRAMLPANTTMTLYSDAAPMFDKTSSYPIPASYMAGHHTVGLANDVMFRSCVQQRMYDAWGLVDSVIKDCGAACSSDNWVNPSFEKFLRQYPDVFVALSSGTYDLVLRGFQSLLQADNCAWDPTEPQYKEGLLKIRTQMQMARMNRGNYATYFVSAIGERHNHVAMSGPRYFELTQTTAGVQQSSIRLQDWLQDLIERPANGLPTTPMQVGP